LKKGRHHRYNATKSWFSHYQSYLACCACVCLWRCGREKIIEALVLSAIFAAVVYYAERTSALPSLTLVEDISLWSKLAIPVGVVTFLMSTLFAACAIER